MPGIDVTAVGRVADFERELKRGADGVLTLPVVLDGQGLSPSLKGSRGGMEREAYVLVGADKTPEPASVSSVGALDILGRSGTTAFVQRLVGGHPRVVRVTKLEDLLPLLQMQRAEAILLPARLKGTLATASRLKLADHEISEAVGLAALATPGWGGGAVAHALRVLPTETSKLFGVDTWR